MDQRELLSGESLSNVLFGLLVPDTFCAGPAAVRHMHVSGNEPAFILEYAQHFHANLHAEYDTLIANKNSFGIGAIDYKHLCFKYGNRLQLA